MQNVSIHGFAISCNCKISPPPWVPFTAVLFGWTDSSRLELMLRFAAVGWTKFWCGEAPFVELRETLQVCKTSLGPGDLWKISLKKHPRLGVFFKNFNHVFFWAKAM